MASRRPWVAAVTELLRPLRCTLPIGWIGGRYTTSNPILAMRGSALAAVANVPCTGLPFLSQPPVDRGNISYQALKRASGRSTHTPCCSPRVIRSRSGYCASSSVTSSDSAAPARVNGSPGLRSASAASISGSRSLRGMPVAARSSSRAPTSRSLDSSASLWPASSLAMTARRQVAIGSPQPSTRKVHSPTRVGAELAVEHVRGPARRHRDGLRLDPRRRRDHGLDRHGLRGRLLCRPLGELRIRRAVVAHHQGGRHGVVTLAPHGGAHRHHLADDGLGGIASAGHHRGDVIDPDTTGHLPTPSMARPAVGPLSSGFRLQPRRALYPP